MEGWRGRLLRSHAATLGSIFDHYARPQRQTREEQAGPFWQVLRASSSPFLASLPPLPSSPSSAAEARKGREGEERGEVREGGEAGGGPLRLLDHASWLQLCDHFSICPHLMSKRELSCLFRQKASHTPHPSPLRPYPTRVAHSSPPGLTYLTYSLLPCASTPPLARSHHSTTHTHSHHHFPSPPLPPSLILPPHRDSPMQPSSPPSPPSSPLKSPPPSLPLTCEMEFPPSPPALYECDRPPPATPLVLSGGFILRFLQLPLPSRRGGDSILSGWGAGITRCGVLSASDGDQRREHHLPFFMPPLPGS